MPKRVGSISSPAKRKVHQLEDELARIGAERAEIQARWDTVSLSLRVLREVVAEEDRDRGGAREPTVGDRVVAFVRTAPAMRQADLAEWIVRNIPTNAKDKKKNAFQVILNLRNAGRLDLDDNKYVVLGTKETVR